MEPSVTDAASELGRRVQKRRVERGWSRIELAERAQVAPETLKVFERTGQISLRRLVRLSVALGCADEWDRLFRSAPPTTLTEVVARGGSSRRQRGRTGAAPTP